ncbi:MAG: transglutaminase-like domain-containing protein [Planctomycetota bacterium]
MRAFFTPIVLCLLLGTSLVTLPCSPASAQFGAAAQADRDGLGVRFDKQMTQRWQVGVIINTKAPCGGITASVPVPTDWPEQTVKVVKEEFSPQVRKVNYRMVEGGVRQMVLDIPMINAGDQVRALVTFEVTRSSILPPPDTSALKLVEKTPRELSKFLEPSPFIESRDPLIRKAALEVFATDSPTDDWTKVEMIYDWVRQHVEYFEGPLKGAVQALKDKKGDCEELTSLFVAICRVHKIPARMVWVPDHCYPEFYMVDDKGKGHWIPCQAAGARSFGGIPEFRPVLQKGDNFKVPDQKEPQRYVAEFLKGKKVTVAPQIEWVRQLLPAE